MMWNITIPDEGSRIVPLMSEDLQTLVVGMAANTATNIPFYLTICFQLHIDELFFPLPIIITKTVFAEGG